MSVRVMSWVFDHAPTVNATEHLVLLAIADRCDDDGRQAYPSVATLAHKTRLSESSVKRAVRALEHRELLVRSVGQSRLGTNVYTVRMAGVTEAPRPERPPPPAGRTSEGGPLGTEAGAAVAPNSSGTPIDPSSTSESIDAVVMLWNTVTTEPLPRCLKATDARKRAIVARLREHGLDGLRRVFERIQGSSFCRGDSDRGWRADLEWALKPSSIVKILEGRYDDQVGGRQRNGRGPSHTRTEFSRLVNEPRYDFVGVRDEDLEED